MLLIPIALLVIMCVAYGSLLRGADEFVGKHGAPALVIWVTIATVNIVVILYKLVELITP